MSKLDLHKQFIQANSIPRFSKAGKVVKAASTVGKLMSEAEAEIAAEKAAKGKFPLDLKRAKPLTKQEITEHADRVARQQAGEHVTSGKPKDTKNLAGRSMKEVKRLEGLDYTLQPTTELRPTPIYEGKVGDINIALPGDQTVADRILLDVNGRQIESPQEGGSLYGEGKLDLEDPLFWASGRQIAQIFQNKVDELARLYNTDDIMAHHLAMGPASNNYAMHFADANLRAIANTDMKKKDIKAFNNIIRDGYVDPKGNKIRLDHFVGIENPEEAAAQMMEDPALRKWFNNRMKVPKITEALGMPNGLDIQWAITEPELRNMEVNLTGHSVGKMKPGAELTDTANHNTYEAGIQGISLGHAPELAPFEVSFPDASDYVKATQRPQDFTGTIQKVFPHQIVDQQQLDQMSEYYRRLREIRGFAKGGKIGKAAGILEELSKLSKVAEGEIAAEKAAKLPAFAPENKPLSFDEFMMSRFPAARDPERVKDYYKQYLNEEFINENNFADGGWSSKHGQKKAEPHNAKKLEIPSWEKLRRTGKLAGKQIAKELTEESPKQTAIDIAGDLAASTAGFPADIANIKPTPITPSKKAATPFGVSGESKVIPREEGVPIASTENFKRMLQENGIISGTERPLTEGLVTLASPAALAKAPKALSAMGKLVKELEGLPAGMSIKDVSQGVQFTSPLEKTVNSHKMESMPGNQWSAWLSANAPKGAKKEAEASGLHDWLKTQGKVSKEEISAFLDENRPQVRAVEKGAPLKLTEAEQHELSDLGKKLADSFYGIGDLTEDEMNRVMYLSNIDEKATPYNLRHQASEWEKAAQGKYRASDLERNMAFRKSEYYNNRADQLELNPIEFGGSKFEKYTLPGGENYKETMLTLPSRGKSAKIPEGWQVKETTKDGKPWYYAETPDTISRGYPTREQAKTQLQTYARNSALVNDYKVPEYHGYQDPDADINRVAHIRTNERPTADEKRALFLEELQSDWAQKGRSQGFKPSDWDAEAFWNSPGYVEARNNARDLLNEFNRNNSNPARQAEIRPLLDEAKRKEQEFVNYSNKMSAAQPSGPYVGDTKDWTALGLKHALKQAVDEGHDYLAWTTGAQQAERYDLSKMIDSVNIKPSSNGEWILSAYKDGDRVMQEFDVPSSELANYIGKDLSEKLLNQETNAFNQKELSGLDLQVGGEGMKGYYDKIIPQTMNDILKQYGIKDGVKEIQFGSPGRSYDEVIAELADWNKYPSGSAERQALLNELDTAKDYGRNDYRGLNLGIEITPELREKVLNEGLTHFKKGGKITKSNLDDEFKINRYMR